MANDHAKDPYDPPAVGSEFEEDKFSEINPGEIFRLKPTDVDTKYRKTDDYSAEEVGSVGVKVEFDANTKVYVKS